MIDVEKINRETPVFILWEYLKGHFPDKFPIEEEMTDFQRGRLSGIIEIERFLGSICEPKEKE